MHAESQKGPRAPKHTYSLADYGLTDEQVKERFAGSVSGHVVAFGRGTQIALQRRFRASDSTS